MKMKWMIFFIASIAHAASDCNYTVTMGSFTAAAGDVAQALPHTLSLSRPQTSSTANCTNYRMYFGKGQANSYQRKAYSGVFSLPYNLYRTVTLGNVLKDYGDAGTNEYLTGFVPTPERPQINTWYVEVKDKDSIFNVPAGVYTDVVPVNIYSVKSNGTLEYETTRHLTLSISIPRYAELSIVPENAPHDPSSTMYVMDFGVMESNDELRADMRIKSNVGYGIYVSSINGGKLSKLAGPTNRPTVPYQIRVGNTSFFTPQTWQQYIGESYWGTAEAGTQYKLRVRLGTVPADLDDGDYQDVITFTVQAY